MTNGVTVTLRMYLKAEAVEGFCERLPAMLKETATRPGFREILVVRHESDPAQVMIIQHWESKEHHEQYMAWRASRGGQLIAEMLARQSELDYWPRIVTRERGAKESVLGEL